MMYECVEAIRYWSAASPRSSSVAGSIGRMRSAEVQSQRSLARDSTRRLYASQFIVVTDFATILVDSRVSNTKNDWFSCMLIENL